jgi:hypothetical protein
MSARLGPGVAVLVIGPTVTGGVRAIGHTGTVDRWVEREQVLPEWDGDVAARAGWVVAFDRPVVWCAPCGQGSLGIFPASSLMPLDGQAEPESTPAAADLPQTVEA